MKKFFFFLFCFLFSANIAYIFIAIAKKSDNEKILSNSDLIVSTYQVGETKDLSSNISPPPTHTEDNKIPPTDVLKNTEPPSVPLEYIDEVIWNKPQSVQKVDILPSDTFFHLQYYLKHLNIEKAWKKVNNSHPVVVAVIDDGVNINHPDLTDNIWVEKDSWYGSSKIKNFTSDTIPDNLPTGRHWTRVAGIIWAEQNNNQGIAGIAKNALIMPLRVFDFEWNARGDDIINAIYYAINHNANIINISLGQSQFLYTDKYDAIFKSAYEKWVVVVIASGNGDILSYKNTGINTTINPLSPVCNNNWGRTYSIWVWSLSQSWQLAPWSNYGACVSLFTPWENIFSTSIALFNKESWVDYDTDNGSSFSAPMIAGIVALWYNQFWYVSPDIVYSSLLESRIMNLAWSYVVDAAKYIDILESKLKK